MAKVFLSSSGTPSAPYSTWATAASSFSVAHGQLSMGGDELVIASDYSEGSLGDFATWPGSREDPIIVISADKTAGGSTITYQAGASLTFSVDADITSTPDSVRWLGVDLACSSNIRFDGSQFFYDLDITTTTASDAIRYYGQAVFQKVTAGNSTDTTNSIFYAEADESSVLFQDVTVNAGNVSNIFCWLGNGGYCHAIGLDATNLASGGDLFSMGSSSAAGGSQIFAYGVKLPTSGGVLSNAIVYDQRVEIYSIATSGSVPGFHVQDLYGTATENVDTYRSATYDGTNNYSVEIEPNVNSTPIVTPFRFKIFEKYLSSANPTLTVEFLYDSATNLQNDEVWLEVFYPDITNPVLQKIDVSSRAVWGATPADLSAGVGTGSWTISPAMTNGNSDRIAVTISGGGVGMHAINVCYANNAAAPVLFVCPNVTVA